MAVLVALIVMGASTLASAAGISEKAKDPPNFVLANDSGNDFQVVSPETGKVIKDLGGIPGYTNNGMALAPNGRDLYITVNRATSLAIQRINLVTSGETFVADGVEPSISPNGRFLAYGSGSTRSQQLTVRDLRSKVVRSIDLEALLGPETDLLNASITWVGSQIVVLPGRVANDLMGGSQPTPPSGSCSAASTSSTCLIVVKTSRQNKLYAKRIVVNGLSGGDIVIGSSGMSNLVMVTFDGHSAVLYKTNLATGGRTATRLFARPSALPVAVDASGTSLFYLVGHGPVSLWVGEVSPHGLMDTRMLNTDVAVAGLAW